MSRSLLTNRTEICDDVRDECSKYGTVVELKVPRPTGGSRQSPGVGKIFVKFDTVESTTNALKALAGRKFSDRTVVTTYFSEVIFSHPDSETWLRLANLCRKTSTSTHGNVGWTVYTHIPFFLYIIYLLCSLSLPLHDA